VQSDIARRASKSLTTFLIDLSPGDMQRRLGDALGIYVDAMRYPRGTEDQRASMWLEHTRRVGWTAVAAVEAPEDCVDSVALSTAPMLGVAYGYCGAPDQWWQQQVIQGLERGGTDRERILELMSSYFELTELHIHPGAQTPAGRSPGTPGAVVHPGDQRRGQPSLAAVPAPRFHRRHQGLPLRRRPTTVRDPRPGIAAVTVTCSLRERSSGGVWHHIGVSHRRKRLLALLLLLLVAPSIAGCVRVRASMTVSPDDRVSGQIIAAAKPANADDKGPQLLNSLPFSEKVSVSSYERDDYVGSQAVFSDLTFSELPQLANMNRDAAGVDISLRRAGDQVILEGRADLTTLNDPDADVSLNVAFPGDVTSTNGEQVSSDVVQWTLKPGVVSTMSAQARYTDPSARSFTGAAIWLAVAAFVVAGIIGGVAWNSRDRSPVLSHPRETR
jgi:hypothetical protein